MPTSFTSYWGDPLHGVEIKWTHDPAAASPTLTFEYTANYYWRMPYWYDAGVADDLTYLSTIGTTFGTDIAADCTSVGDNAYATSSSIDLYMKWFMASPTDSSLYDGFNGQCVAHFNCGDKRTDPSNSNDPSIYVEWIDTATPTAFKYDLKPTSEFDITEDASQDDWTTTEAMWDGTTPESSGVNLCKETWLLSDTAAACVKTVGGASRDWTSTDADDIDFDYVVYQIATQFGKSDDATADSQFSQISVDFATFQESETANATALFPAALLLMSAITFVAHFF